MKSTLTQSLKQLRTGACAAVLLGCSIFAVAQTSPAPAPAPTAPANSKPKPAPKAAKGSPDAATKQASKDKPAALNATSHIALRDGDVTEVLRILPDSQRQELRAQLAEFKQTHKQDIAVLITYGLKSPKTPMERSGDAMPEYVQQIAQAWQMGREKEGEGMLMVVAIGERALSIGISPAPPLRAALSPAVTDEIINTQMVPFLRKGELGSAIKAAISEIDNRLRAQASKVPDAPSPAPAATK